MNWLAYRLCRLLGWSFEGDLPDVPKFIAIGAPHTTNWDFFLFMAALHHYRMKVRYIGKHTLFRWPVGYLFRALGGIPVDRSKPGGVVGQVTRAFAETDRMILVMAPEGTRKSADHWKSGFVKIAEAAGVPIVLASVDYLSRTVEIGPSIDIGDGIGALMDRTRDFYGDKHGRRPTQKGPVILVEEGIQGS